MAEGAVCVWRVPSSQTEIHSVPTETLVNIENMSIISVISLANKGGNEWKRFCQGHFLIVLHDHLECVILVSLYHSAESRISVNTYETQ